MKTIIVDDEPWMLEQFRQECDELEDIEMDGMFTSAADALEHARTNRVDFALLDVEMPGMTGIELSEKLRELYPEMIIIFVTAYPEYVREMLAVRGDYIVIKPYSREQVTDAISRARLLSHRLRKRVFIRTFGDFELFVDDIPVHFSTKKAKELIALLTDVNGAFVDARKAFPLLWEGVPCDDAHMSYYRKALASLEKVLEEYGVGDILIHKGREVALCRDKVDCDLYIALEGDMEGITSFDGSYMSQYSWGEVTLGYLERLRWVSQGGGSWYEE
ncbi:MAG: response regulator [Eubacteriaceae bacterium]|nr:response regulator [Eubacteriaceae bacterium]